MGQEAPPGTGGRQAGAAGQATGYERAFDLLAGLALPGSGKTGETATPSYVRLEIAPAPGAVQLEAFWDTDTYQARGSRGGSDGPGNAWLLGPAGGGAQRFLLADGRTVAVVERKAAATPTGGGGLRGFLRRLGTAKAPPEKATGGDEDGDAEEPPPGSLTGAWVAVDVPGEAEVIRKRLVELAQERRWSGGRTDPGRLLLFATMAHRAGFEEDAASVADLLLASTFDPNEERLLRPREVIYRSLALIAEGRLTDARRRFVAGGDWGEYAAEVGELGSTFTAGWPALPAARRLHQLLRQRASGDPLPTPSGPVPLSEVDFKLARDLAEAEDLGTAARLGLWVLPAGRGAEEATRRPSPEPEGLIAEILGRRMESVPLLLALVGDDTPIRGQWNRDDHYVSSRISFIGEEPDERQLFAALPRPATRSEVARDFIGALLISGEDWGGGFEEFDDNAFRSRAEAWFQTHGKSSPAELARTYLRLGDSNQQADAFLHLATSDLERDRQEAEKHLLSPAGIGESNLLTAYVRARGGAARDFLNRYQAALDKADDQLFEHWGGKKNVARVIEGLRPLVSAETAEDILAAVVGGEKEPMTAYRPLYTKLENRPLGEASKLLLGAAADIDGDERRSEMVEVAYHILLGKRYSGMRYYGDTEHTPPSYNPVADAAHWRALMEWEAGLPDGTPPGESGSIAQKIEQLATDPDDPPPPDIENLIQAEFDPLVGRRARQRLEGKAVAELDPWPDPGAVGEDRVQSLVEQLATAPADSVREVAAALTLAERTAIAQQFQVEDIEAAEREGERQQAAYREMEERINQGNFDGDLNDLEPKPVDREPVPPRRGQLAAPAHLVTRVTDRCDPPLGGRDVLGLTGKPLTWPVVEAAARDVAALAVEGRLVSLQFYRKPLFAGIEVTIKNASPSQAEGWTERLELDEPAVIGQLTGRGGAYTLWKVAELTGTGGAEGGDGDDPDDPDEARYNRSVRLEDPTELAREVEDFTSGRINPTIAFRIYLMGVVPPPPDEP